MAGNWPLLDPEALAALRRLVRAMHEGGGRQVPLPELVALAGQRLGAGVTIDFEASRELGEPMVVLRLDRASASEALAELTRREREVAALVASGLSNKQ